jgi:hypothetical protein
MKAGIDIQELLQEKDYIQLTPEERKYILEHFSEADYEEQRAVIKDSQQFFRHERELLQPDIQIKQALDKAFRAKFRKPVIRRLAEYKISLYKAGIAAAVLMYFLHSPQPEPKVIIRETPVIVYRTDTVRIEQQGPGKIRSSAKTVSEPLPVAGAVPAETDRLPETMYGMDLDESLAKYGSEQTGRSMKEDSVLASVLVSAVM